ncbi:MAG: choice-of-anchor D domain-containing protein [Acidobacteria bacterium]|nr:choice-of-anchor D domain-containing protein [Acidobacteriota bacterium]
MRVMRFMMIAVIAAASLHVMVGRTSNPAPNSTSNSTNRTPMRMRGVTNAQRKVAAARAAQRRIDRHKAQKAGTQAPVGPALTLDQLYFGTYPNIANSPLPQTDVNGVVLGGGIRKFVDTLPGLNSPNNLGQQIPVAVPDKATFPGSDYYEIGLVQYTERLHSDLPPTTLRGYVQLNGGNPNPQYLGPLIVAQRDVPVRIKFVNQLPTGAGGNLFIPVDKTVMGAGMGPDGMSMYLENRATLHLHGGNTPWISDGTPHQWTVPAGDSGTTYPKGVSTQYVPDMFFDSTGSVVPVPKCDANITTNCWPNAVPPGLSNNPGPGAMTFYYTNQQSARLMFYHDHAYGITRLNVYAGEAAGYLLQDQTEAALVSAGTIPAMQIPLVIQDKTFVPPNPSSTPLYSAAVLMGGQNYNLATTTVAIDPLNIACTVQPTAVPVIGDQLSDFGQVIHNAVISLTLTGKGMCSSSPDIVITDSAATPGTGAMAFGSLATLAQQDPTWDPALWGGEGNLWFPHVYMPNQYPDNPDGSNMNAMGRLDYGMWFWPPMVVGPPGTGQLVHGDVPCPTAAIPNQRCPGFPAVGNPDAATGSTVSLLPEGFMDTPVINGTAYPTVTVPAGAVRFRILNAANDRNMNLSLFVADPTVPCATGVIAAGCEVKMVPAVAQNGWPVYWPTDGRDGGVPDPATAGPSWIQIGTEAGIMPNPVVIPPAPVGYEYNRRSITVLNVSTKALFMGPAERADVIVDFSAFAGKTLILYNDAPAPVPAFDSRYDYYTGDPDQTAVGGAPTTIAGYGPNTRTMMQIVVGAPDGTSASLAALQAQLPAAFAASQPPPIVPQAAYSAAFGTNFPDVFARLQNHNLTFNPFGGTAPVTLPMQDKTIQELFELDYGRMNATLGTELPFTNFNRQTTIPLGYIDPPSEVLTDSKSTAMMPVGTLGDGTQLWQITHNGVDTHTIHFHLFNVQLINRFGWDGTTRPPDPNEIGWKESVRMNPLEIDYVALRPMSQNLPWPIPDSVRPMDVTMPPDVWDPMMSLQNSAGGAADMINHTTNFGWEYVWHCHLLGHEENDMMRPIILQVPPDTPNPLSAIANVAGGVDLTFTDNSANETAFILQRDTDPAFPAPFSIPVAASIPNSAFGSGITYTDTGVGTSVQLYYRVQAIAGGLSSGWSITAPFITAPIAGISPAGPLAFGNQGVGTLGAPQSVTLSNTGTSALTFSVALTSPDFAQNSTCTGTLFPGSTCAISVAFGPTVIGPLTGALTIASNDPVNPLFTIQLNGTGIAATTTAISAPDVVYGLNGTVTVTVTSAQANVVPGTVTLAVDGGQAQSQTLAGGSATFTLTAPTAGSHTLVANFAAQGGFQSSTANGTLVVTTAPLSITAGSGTMIYGGAVPAITPSFTGFVLGQNQSVLTTQPTCTTVATNQSPVGNYGSSCTGAVAANYAISYVAGTVTVGKATSATVIISNAPNPAIVGQVVTITFNVTPQFVGSTPTGSVTVSANTGESCTVALPAVSCNLAFATGGNRTLTATYAGDGNFNGSASAPVNQGVGGVSLSTTSLLFGNQLIGTNSATQTITLSNVGTLNIAISSIVNTNNVDFSFTTTCGLNLRVGRSCNIVVRFHPTTLGVRSGTITITDSDPSLQVVSLTGTGVAPVNQVSPNSIAFGNVPIRTTSAAQTVTVSNPGTAPLAITRISVNGGNANQFAQTSNCPASLAVGTNCTVSVTFRPTTRGAKASTLNVTVGAPATSAAVPLTGTGQ